MTREQKRKRNMERCKKRVIRRKKMIQRMRDEKAHL